MELKTLGRTGIRITPAGMGVLTVGRTQLNLPVAEGAGIVRYALEQGINFLDTAEYYETYPYIAAALKGFDGCPVVASKSFAASYSEMKKAVEDMRRALGLDVIDIFLLHEIRGVHDFEMRSGAWACLNDLKAKGIVRAIGLSTHHVDVAELNAGQIESDVLFPLINKAGLGIRYKDDFGTKEAMAAAIARNSAAGKGVFTMKVFGGGNLTGDYLSALDYVHGLPGVDSIMVGIGHRDEVDRLVEYFEGAIDRNYVPNLREKHIRIDKGDCEGCGACLSRCPNRAIRMTDQEIAEVDHAICLTCGYCAPVCPVRAIILF